MNSKTFIVLFFNLAMVMYANAIWEVATLPLATATYGTMATPLAVLGVLKLGAAAAIALGYLALGNDDDEYVESGYGYGGDDYHRRGKRDAQDSAPSEEGIFALIASMDSHGCGKQLICELEARNAHQLAADERLMLQLFSKNNKNTVNPASAKSEYILAAQLGMASKNEIICRERYSACPYTAVEMMEALRNSHL